jgi:hypothetical protein
MAATGRSESQSQGPSRGEFWAWTEHPPKDGQYGTRRQGGGMVKSRGMTLGNRGKGFDDSFDFNKLSARV